MRTMILKPLTQVWTCTQTLPISRGDAILRFAPTILSSWICLQGCNHQAASIRERRWFLCACSSPWRASAATKVQLLGLHCCQPDCSEGYWCLEDLNEGPRPYARVHITPLRECHGMISERCEVSCRSLDISTIECACSMHKTAGVIQLAAGIW